jgi:uncharacterized protein
VASFSPGLVLARRAQRNASRALGDIEQSRADRRDLHLPDRLERLTEAQTVEFLRGMHLGRLAYVAREGEPDVVPVNYSWCDGAVLIRSGPGPKLQAAKRREILALEVDDVDPMTRSGTSAVVIGRAEVLPAWAPVPTLEVWAGEPRRHVIRVVPRRVTGRRLVVEQP